MNKFLNDLDKCAQKMDEYYSSDPQENMYICKHMKEDTFIEASDNLLRRISRLAYESGYWRGFLETSLLKFTENPEFVKQEMKRLDKVLDDHFKEK